MNARFRDQQSCVCYDLRMYSTVTQRCAEAVAAGVMPGAAYVAVTPAGVASGAVGTTTYEPGATAVTTEHVFDVASLTKLMVMGVAAQLIDEGVLAFNTRVADVLPEFASQPQKHDVTMHHLMTYTVEYRFSISTHDALAHYTPEQVLTGLTQLPVAAPPGTTYRYTDVTIIILTQLLERVTGQSLPQLCAERFFQPLGMKQATFYPETLSREQVVPTEHTAERGLVWGSVHDEKAAFLKTGDITAGAAGLFATIADISAFLQPIIGQGVLAGKRYWSEEMVARWHTDQFPSITTAHTPIMWGDRFGQPRYEYHNRPYHPSLYGAYPGTLITKGGFTGCFVAVDLDRQRAVVVLANTVHPQRAQSFRPFNALKEDLIDLLASA